VRHNAPLTESCSQPAEPCPSFGRVYEATGVQSAPGMRKGRPRAARRPSASRAPQFGIKCAVEPPSGGLPGAARPRRNRRGGAQRQALTDTPQVTPQVCRKDLVLDSRRSFHLYGATSMGYTPPYTLTPSIVRLLADAAEAIGRLMGEQERIAPRLRKENRIRTIQATLQIEQNTFSVEQVTAILEGKRVKGTQREILEVKNASYAYEKLPSWNPASRKDFLDAHRVLMEGLVERPGRFRSGGVGVIQGTRVVHMAPPAMRVPALVDDLLDWSGKTKEHPLVASCVLHYELEFIHPFADGNGRLGRLWQTLALSKWKSVFADLPLESVVRDHQESYYASLGASDKAADCSPFIEFLLGAILQAVTPQVAPQVTPQVAALLKALGAKEWDRARLQEKLGLSDRKSFRALYLAPAMEQGLVEFTLPEKPNSRLQKYRVTSAGRAALR
jgi:fido (protein-threonine AMPylation protein)